MGGFEDPLKGTKTEKEKLKEKNPSEELFEGGKKIKNEGPSQEEIEKLEGEIKKTMTPEEFKKAKEKFELEKRREKLDEEFEETARKLSQITKEIVGVYKELGKEITPEYGMDNNEFTC